MTTLDLDPTSLRDLALHVSKRLKGTIQRASMVASADGCMMTLAETYTYIGMSRTNFYHLRRGTLKVNGDALPPFPAPRHNGSGLVWRRREVDRWIDLLPLFSDLPPDD